MAYLLMVCTLVQPEQPRTYGTPETAVAAYRQAIERADVEFFARLTAGKEGESLRKLAPVLKKTQKASEEFSRALSEKPALSMSNPFVNDFNPLANCQFELVDLVKSKDDFQARVRFGVSGRMTEESLAVRKEGDTYRLSLPGTYLKSMQLMSPERLSKQMETLNALTTILNKLSEQIKKGELTTRESILSKLAQEVKAAKLGD